jgi:hypothetical protein
MSTAERALRVKLLVGSGGVQSIINVFARPNIWKASAMEPSFMELIEALLPSLTTHPELQWKGKSFFISTLRIDQTTSYSSSR